MKYITYANFGYLSLTKNLIESFKKLNIDSLLTVICTDLESYQELNINNKLFFNINLYKENLNFGSNEFNKFTVYKLYIILEQLQNTDKLVYVDSDIYFYKNPTEVLSFLFNYTEFFIQSDLPGTPVSTGFVGFKKTANNIKLLENTIDSMNKLNGESWWCDQNYMISEIQKSTHYPVVLPTHLFPNGHYSFNYKGDMTQAYLIHANYVVGLQQKIDKLKEFNAYAF